MGPREMQTTTRSPEVEATVAFGSMLVFASVMPSLAPEDAPESRERQGAAGTDDLLDLCPDEPQP